jgi:hypothetical protein
MDVGQLGFKAVLRGRQWDAIEAFSKKPKYELSIHFAVLRERQWDAIH